MIFKDFIGLTEESENIRLCLIDCYYNDDDCDLDSDSEVSVNEEQIEITSLISVESDGSDVELENEFDLEKAVNKSLEENPIMIKSSTVAR